MNRIVKRLKSKNRIGKQFTSRFSTSNNTFNRTAFNRNTFNRDALIKKAFKKMASRKKLYRKANEETYTFDELSKAAQQKALNDYSIDYPEMVQDIVNDEFDYRLSSIFPNSDLEYTYSLSFSQGDGFGLTGSIDIDDASKITGISFSEDEKELFEECQYPRTTDISIHNNGYSPFFTDDMIDVYMDEDMVKDTIEDSYDGESPISNIKEFSKKTKDFETKLIDYLEDFCGEMEDFGYKMFYPDDDALIEDLMSNDWMYAKDGTILY